MTNTTTNPQPTPPSQSQYCFCAPCSCRRLEDPGRDLTAAEIWITKSPNPQDHADSLLQDEYNRKFAWAILNRATTEILRQYSPLLEVASGMGYWAYELQNSGVHVIPTDPDSPADTAWTRVSPLTGTQAIRKYPGYNLLFCWPEMEEWPTAIVRDFRGPVLIYVGEERKGCTGNQSMFDALEQHYTLMEEHIIPRFSLNNDRLFVYGRN